MVPSATHVFSTCMLLLVSIHVHAQSSQKSSNPCIEQKTCGACIAASAECGWCTAESFDLNNRDRCDKMSNLVGGTEGCDYDLIVKPDHEPDYTRDLSPTNAEDGAPAIQLSPQQMNLKIRPNKPFTFRVHYRQAENYPVDLYYIMDLSYSMRDDKDKVAELGDLLSEEMVKITKNFRLGFGSFIDKKTMPYVSTVPDALILPCKGCVAPYGFKNQLNLTDDTSLFRNRVLDAAISGNLDSPEGGFDAMMQAITCKLGGIVKPNDGHCHMDTAGYYSESLNQDYPSISQIANKVLENNVNVIFAVTADRISTYRKLMPFIEGSVVGELADDSANVVELVKENYERISGQVELKSDAPEGVHVTFKAYCLNGEVRDSGKCDQVGIGQNVSYDVTIEVRECPADADLWRQTLEIYPVGLAEKLEIQMEMMCECDCEKDGEGEQNSQHCNNNGTYECGACTCNEGLYGKNCECDATDIQGDDYDAQCRMLNTSKVCEGHGECVCGICDCGPVSTGPSANPSHKWSGRYCECNNYACDYADNNRLCGGPDQGQCKCGTCICNPEYMGEACECPISQEMCRASNGKICNGEGSCVCGKCVCDNFFYRGDTCEDCPTCPGKCEANKDCVQCKAFDTGKYKTEADCKANCSNWDQIKIENSVEEKPGWKHCKFRDDDDGCFFYFIYQYVGEGIIAQRTKENSVWKKCRFRDDDGCFFYFSYRYDPDIVAVQKERECPIPVNMGFILIGLLILIVLIGLLLLCLWKILVTIYDRREYARFEKELEKAKWDMAENPIFKPATSTYTNPMK